MTGLLFQVIFGGGRRVFFPNTTKDKEKNSSNRRQDGKDLVRVFMFRKHFIAYQK
jgi:alkaline phosphatase